MQRSFYPLLLLGYGFHNEIKAKDNLIMRFDIGDKILLWKVSSHFGISMAHRSGSLTVSNQSSYTELQNFLWFTTVGPTLGYMAGKMLTQQSHTIHSLLPPWTTTTGASKVCSSTLIAATFTLLMELLSIKSAFFIMTKPSSSIKYHFLSKFIPLFLWIKKMDHGYFLCQQFSPFL